MIDYKELDAGLAKDKRVKKVIELVGSGNDVLDLGAFSGYIAREITKNNNKVVATDSNPKFVDHCIKTGLFGVVVDCEDELPFNDSSFDVIVAGEIIEHIYDTNKFLKECNRVLKSNGKLIITTPNMGFWKHRIKLLLGLNMPFEYGHHGFFVNHIRYFNLASLKRAVRDSGFFIKRVETSYYFTGNEGNRFLNVFIPNIFKNHGFHIIAVLEKDKNGL